MLQPSCYIARCLYIHEFLLLLHLCCVLTKKRQILSLVLVWLLSLNLQYDFTLNALVYTITQARAAITHSEIMKSKPHLHAVFCFLSIAGSGFTRGGPRVKGELIWLKLSLNILVMRFYHVQGVANLISPFFKSISRRSKAFTHKSTNFSKESYKKSQGCRNGSLIITISAWIWQSVLHLDSWSFIFTSCCQAGLVKSRVKRALL